MEIGVVRQGKDKIERFHGIKNFSEEFDRESMYSDDDTLKKVLKYLLNQIYEYLLPGLEEISKEKYMDKWELTPEVYIRFYDEKENLKKVLSMRYDTANMTEDKLLLLTIKVIVDCKEKKLEEVEDILMGLAVLFGNFIVENLEECWWERSRTGSRKYSVFCRERYNQPNGTEIVDVQILRIIKDAWWKQNINSIYYWYYELFVKRRKMRKALSLWNREKERKAASTEERRNIIIVVGQLLMPFIEQYGFCYSGYDGKKMGYLCCWEKREGRQEIWLMREEFTKEMWIRVVTKSGRKLEIQDVREGLEPYDRAEYCLGTEISQSGQFIRTVNKLKEQISDIWIPALNNEEAYLLRWELTPEMIKREIFDKKQLLEKLDKAYGITGITKEELSEFVKRVLSENEDKTLEEFEDTLLGLGALLGEAAIKEVAGSHWMWDKNRSACLITYRNEVTGIDPAFTLNYAWQRRKPENVDRLCRDLFEGSYIENRERGGYDIRKA